MPAPIRPHAHTPALLLSLILLSGCASVSYGPLTIRTLGTDVTFEDATWIKKAPDGSIEALVVHGGKKDASSSAHTAANTALAALGAIIGSPAGIAGASAGSAAGLSLSELWQSVQDYLASKGDPQVAPSPAPASGESQAPASSSSPELSTQPSALSTSSLVLMDPPVTEAWVKGTDNGRTESLQIESRFNIIFRGCVKRPSVNSWWYLTTPWIADGRTIIQRQGDNVVVPDVIWNGTLFHCVGWRRSEPQPGNLNPTLDFVGNSAPWGTKFAIIECRKAAQ